MICMHGEAVEMASSFEQAFGGRAMAGGGVYLASGSRDLSLQPRYPGVKLLNRQRVQILQTQQRQRVARSLRQVIVGVHGG